MKFLDTTIIIDFLKDNKEAVNKIKTVADEDLGTTTINMFEILFGIYKNSKNKDIELQKFKSFLDKINVFSFDESASFKASEIAADLANKGELINTQDFLIAGILRANNYNTIITRDKDHFSRIRGLEIISY